MKILDFKLGTGLKYVKFFMSHILKLCIWNENYVKKIKFDILSLSIVNTLVQQKANLLGWVVLEIIYIGKPNWNVIVKKWKYDD